MFSLIHKSVKVIITVLVLYLSCLHGFSQTKVTGHIFAEIVESASIMSQTNNFLILENNTFEDNLFLGKISLKGGSNFLISVNLNTDGVRGNETLDLELSINSMEKNVMFINEDGTKTYNIVAEVKTENQSFTSKDYSAHYEIIFIHN